MPSPASRVVVSSDWVAAHLNDPSIAIAEVDSHPGETYAVGHIPGAIGWGLHTDFEDSIRRDIPTADAIASLLGKAGVANDTPIVLYGDGNNRSATWAFWVLKYYGHNDVRLMDGGRKKWLAESRPLTTKDTPRRKSVAYVPGRPHRQLRALRDQIVKRIGKDGVTILDTRAYEEFAGLLTAAPGGHQPDIQRKGRIPGAVHLPWDDASASDGSFKPAVQLRKLYSSVGVSPDDEIIAYCRLGVRASYSWFVLKYLLGYANVRNYDGSWTEWGNAIGVPIETGEPKNR
ncbi:MAG: sulfurtransferase [SAR202 cluster bacterium]|nr:sulfurtransferase [SAR202 cluster bacterium]